MSTDPRKTLLDPWQDHASSKGLMCRVRESMRVGVMPRVERDLVLDRYEASLAKAASTQGRRTLAVPDMHSWAKVLGVDIMPSKTAERDRRRLEREEPGMSKPGPGKWAHSSSLSRENLYSRNKYFDRDNLIPGPSAGPHWRSSEYQGGASRGAAVPEVVALDGFLSDLQGRVVSLEGTAGVQSTPKPGSSGIAAGGITHYGRLASGVHGPGKPTTSDLYGVPVEVMTNAMEVRR